MLTVDNIATEQCKTVFWEQIKKLDDAGWNTPLVYNKRVELPVPIPVVIQVENDKYVITHVDKARNKVERPATDDWEEVLY